MATVRLVGAVAIVLAAWQLRRRPLGGLLTALVGMAAGGGMIWVVRRDRQRGAAARGDGLWRRDADVHDRRVRGLAGGTGRVLSGSVLGTGYRCAAMGRCTASHEIPYGPFLCLATLLVS